VAAAFEREGLLHLRGRAAGLRRTGVSGKLVVQVNMQTPQTQPPNRNTSPKHSEELEVEAVLVATGRVPCIVGLGLERAGVEVDAASGGIRVDKAMRTSVRNIFAAGDCTGTVHQFTHFAGVQAAVAVRNALLPSTSGVDAQCVPRVTFTDPEVAHVGLTEAEHLKRHGLDAGVIRWDLDRMDRAICENEDLGFVKLLFSKKSTRLHGATVVCSRAGEIMQELAVAIASETSIKQLALVMHAYPTFSFALQEMAGDIYMEKLTTGCVGCLVAAFKTK